jgi:DNA-binding CsgD family transcriptional regulator/tetratricopeptide (TPR) repeat protein
VDVLERDAVLASLDDELAESVSGHGRVVLVTGEAGIGKSTVVRAFLSAHQAAVRIAVGQCDPVDAPRPLGPIVDIAAGIGQPQLFAHGSGAGSEVSAFHAALVAKPTIAVIEDAHWADDATLDALVHVARRIDLQPVLLVVTYRSDEVGPTHPLRATIGRLANVRPRRLPLARLSVDGVRALCGSAGVDADALHELTGGNPFYVSEVLAAGSSDVPESVVDSVLARASLLSPQGRDALEAASVVPSGVDAAVLRWLGPAPAAIDECVMRGLLVSDAGRLTFRHELARRAIEESLPPMRRRDLHADVLRQLTARLTQSQRDPAELAYHAVLAVDADATLLYSELAARRAVAVGAHGSARLHFRTVVDTLGADPTERLAVALEGLGHACWVLGRADEAVDSFRAAIDVRAALGDVDAAGRDRVLVSVNLWWQGHGAEARAEVDRAIDELRAGGSTAALGFAFGYRARLLMLSRDIEGAIGSARSAIAIGREEDDALTLAQAYNSLGTAMWFFDPDQAEPALAESIRHAEAAGDRHLVASALSNLGSGAGEIKRYDVARRWLTDAIAYCAAHDIDGSGEYAEAWMARVLLEQGAWSEAAAFATRVVDRQAARTVSLIVAGTVLATVRIRRGDPGHGGLLAAAWADAQDTGDLQRLWPVAVARAEAAWWGGADPGVVAGDLADTLRLATERGHPWAVGELSLWLRRLELPWESAVAPADPYRLWLTGDTEAARDAWLELGCPYEAAWALLDRGDEGAVRAAFDEFGGLGAQPASKQCRDSLRALGATAIPRGVRAATAADPAGLTQREAEVLGLVSDGMTNREIADRLVLSTRTVDHHVAAVLRKLGVGTREEAVALRGEPT